MVKNRVKTLLQNSHMHFDFTTLKGFKVAPNDKKNREKGEQEKEDKRMEEKRLTCLLIFISCTYA